MKRVVYVFKIQKTLEKLFILTKIFEKVNVNYRVRAVAKENGKFLTREDFFWTLERVISVQSEKKFMLRAIMTGSSIKGTAQN